MKKHFLLLIALFAASLFVMAEMGINVYKKDGSSVLYLASSINRISFDDVTIENLTVVCSGERAINIIQNATNVTIDNVTATAANYTVNVASSAKEAVVAIKNSTLTGLCTVNVTAPGANVTITNTEINCNDN